MEFLIFIFVKYSSYFFKIKFRSGTASEPTPAYLANTLLHDHHESFQLQNGATVHVDIESALSIDLNGAIQLSLWGRNAQIQVNKK